MKRILVMMAVFILLAFTFTGCKEATGDNAAPTIAPTTAPISVPTEAAADSMTETSDNAPVVYKDGVYEVETDPDYENFSTKATVTIEGGAITAVDWSIYDTKLDQPFDEEYYHVYETVSDAYVKQAKDDWSGSRGYTDALIESQEVSKVDAVSGATWTNKKFKEIVTIALEKAKN